MKKALPVRIGTQIAFNEHLFSVSGILSRNGDDHGAGTEK